MEGDTRYLNSVNGDVVTAWDANPYRREAWGRGEAAAATAADEGGRDRSCAANPRVPMRRAPRASLSGSYAGLSCALAGVRVVPLVAAVAFAVFVLIAVFELADIYGASAGATPIGVVSSAAPARAGDGSDAASTPRSQWQAGQVPFLYQTDPSWSSAPYAGADVESSGCGPTSLTMVYVALTGNTDYDPESMAAFSEAGGYVEGGLTAWRLMSEGAAELGLASREVPADASRLESELRAGHPVICSVGPGDFTDEGHFIVLAGLDDEGRLVVHDPNSPANSAQTWDLDRVLGQCRNLWAFERA